MEDKKEVIPAYWKQLFFKLGSTYIVKLLVRFGLKMAGPVGWVASFFIDKILKVAWAYIVKITIKTQEKKETAKELKEYKEEINKPGASADEIKDAGKDFLSN